MAGLLKNWFKKRHVRTAARYKIDNGIAQKGRSDYSSEIKSNNRKNVKCII